MDDDINVSDIYSNSSDCSSISDFDTSPNSINIDIDHGLGSPLDKTKLTVLHFNVCSLTANGRLEELENILNKLEVDILALTETHLDSSIPNNVILIKNFHEPIRHDRKINGRSGGGCAIYIKESHAFVHKVNLQTENFEHLWVDVFCNGKRIAINCLYRPPNESNHELFLSTSSDILHELNNYKADSKLIVGDLNFGNIYCVSPTLEPKRLDYFAPDTFTEHGFFQLIDIPTRVSQHSTSLLDLIFIDNIVNVVLHGTIPKIADHDGVLVVLNVDKTIPVVKSRKVYDYSKIDFKSLEEHLKTTNFNDIVFNKPIEQQAETFSKFLIKTIETFVPVKYVKYHSKDQPWSTKLTKLLQRKKNRNYIVYKKTNECLLNALNKQSMPDEILTKLQDKVKNKLKKYRYTANESTKANRRAKANFYNSIKSILHNNEIPAKKKFNILINLMKSAKHTPIPPLVENDKVINDPKLKANVFNKHFAEKAQLNGFGDPCPPLPRKPNIPDYDHINTSPLEVKYFINRLKKSHKSHCGISGKFLQLISKPISAPLSRLYNNLFSIGLYPSTWKIAQVSPVFKRNGSKVDKNNYRPISILPTLSKVCESVIHARLLDHCVEHNVISNRQAAYLKGDSTISQLTYLVHKIRLSWGQGKITQCVFLDISAAFDKVYHNGLIAKLEQIGIVGQYKSLFMSYLEGRKQKVSVEGEVSEEVDITAGIPQGSRLGPLLFIIYIEDISNSLESEILLFADDTTIFIQGSDPVETSRILNRDLLKIQKWANQWKVTFNAKKSNEIIFSQKLLHNSPPLYLNGQMIERVCTHKHLGIFLSQDLTWSLQVHETCLKASRKLFVLRSIKFLDRRTLDMLYKITVRSVIDYGLPIYGNNLRQNEMHRLENIQYKAAKVVTGAYHQTSKQKLYQELGWETIQERCEYLGLTMFHKIHLRETRPLVRECMPAPNINTRYACRNSGEYLPFPYINRQFGQSFFPYFSKKWSKLPRKIRILPMKDFKENLKVNIKPAKYKHFSVGSKEGNQLLTKIRVGRSLLNSHLFEIGKSNNPNCLCCDTPETVKHYMFECSRYTIDRQILFSKIAQHYPTFLNLCKIKQYTILINGVDKEIPENYKLNRLLSFLVQSFILKTKRFV